MMHLNETQVATVTKHLDKARLSAELRTELVDHLCCMIEEKMEGGDSFAKALEATLSNWETKELRSIDRQIFFTTKFKPMVLRISTAAFLLASLLLLFPMKNRVDNVLLVSTESAAEMTSDDMLCAQSFSPPSASPIAGMKLNDAHSKFGMRTHPIYKTKIMHQGIDFKAKPGTPVLSTADGTIEFARSNGKHGIQVRIQHADGYTTVYSHLKSHGVKVGQEVKLGEVIAKVGSTGIATGPHLHYEVRKNGTPENPLAMLR